MSAPASLASSTAVDLSRLPQPDIVETLEFETLFAERLADFQALYPDHDALVESDPVFKLLETGAYVELTLRQRVNEAASACMVAFALGGDLDNLGAVFGVTRQEVTPADEETGAPAVLESDEALRRRILLAPDGYSVAGPTAAYLFHALSASGDVADAAASSPAPGEVLVSILSREGDGTASQDLIDTVEAAVGADTVRPLTDQVTVQSAAIVPFSIDARLSVPAGPDEGLIYAAAMESLTALLTERRRIGQDISRSALFAALHVGGVRDVDLVEPAASIAVGPDEAAHAAAISVIIVEAAE